MHKILAFLKKPLVAAAVGAVVGVIVNNRTGVINAGLSKIPGVKSIAGVK